MAVVGKFQGVALCKALAVTVSLACVYRCTIRGMTSKQVMGGSHRLLVTGVKAHPGIWMLA